MASSEAAFGFESPPLKPFPAVASDGEARCSGPEKWKKTCFLCRDADAVGRRQVFEAKMSETNGNKLWKLTSFFLGIQRQRVAAKVQAGEARFGPELDFEKP